jgi:hypothetical protein
MQYSGLLEDAQLPLQPNQNQNTRHQNRWRTLVQAPNSSKIRINQGYDIGGRIEKLTSVEYRIGQPSPQKHSQTNDHSSYPNRGEPLSYRRFQGQRQLHPTHGMRECRRQYDGTYDKWQRDQNKWLVGCKGA